MTKRDERQAETARWAEECFGREQTTSVEHRGIRFIEEAIELAQAAGVKSEMVHKLVDYIYSRPTGTLHQELGGVGLTTMLLAHAANMSADESEYAELQRVLNKPRKMFAERNANKDALGFKA